MVKKSALRAVAIFAPQVSPRRLLPFEQACGPIEVVEEVAPGLAADAALIFGGDGTLHRHLAGLAATQVPLLAVPAGSANDFAWNLGLRSLDDALTAWRKFAAGGGNLRAVDLGVIESPAGAAGPHEATYFCCVAGCGLDAEANRRANALPRWLRAHGGYQLAALLTILLHRSQTITVIAQDAAPGGERRLSRPARLVAFGNSPTYGGGMRIAPGADLEDGLLDLCFVSHLGRLRLLRFFPTVLSGRHVGMKEVEYFQTSRLQVETQPPLDVYADGEYVGQTPIAVRIQPRALRVVAP
ncbi:MAG TPA: diacylglycerol kinase family protein [Terriglobales bacterium]|nr:diacylglycerol kinase family protein [Terriglobales bacterium]